MDKSGFHELFHQHYKHLYLVAYQYVKRSVIAEELVQDVFLKIWDKRNEIQFTISPRAYLQRSVVNAALNFIQQESRKLNLEKNYTYTLHSAPDEETSDLIEQRMKDLETAVNALPPQCQKVLRMSKIQGFKQQEIADQMNISIKTVKNHLTYGYERLRAQFGISKNS